MNLRERIDHNIADFSPSETQIAAYLLAHLEAAPLLTGAELAAQLEISASSITRFAQRLGFEGYPDLRRELRRQWREQQAPDVPKTKEGVFAAYWTREKQNLEELSRVSETLLERVCETLAAAKQLWVLGSRSNFGHAVLTHELLLGVRQGVRLLESKTIISPETLLEVSPEDIVLIFATRRYARATTQIGLTLKTKGAKIILITDNGDSPLVPHATQVIRVPTQAINQYGATGLISSLAHLLVIGTAQRTDSTRRKQLEQLLEELSVFE